MAGDDILKIDDIVLQPLEKCLLLLSYRSDKMFLEELMHKEMLKSMK